MTAESATGIPNVPSPLGVQYPRVRAARPHRLRRRALFMAWLVIAGGVSTFIAGAARASSALPPLQLVRTLPLNRDQSGVVHDFLVVDSKAGILYDVNYPSTDQITTYNLATLRETGVTKLSLPAGVSLASAATTGDFPSPRLYLAASYGLDQQGAIVTWMPGAPSVTVTNLPPTLLASAEGAGQGSNAATGILGLTYDALHNRLYALYAPPLAAEGLYITQMVPPGTPGYSDNDRVLWTGIVPSECQLTKGGLGVPQDSPERTVLYLVCLYGSLNTEGGTPLRGVMTIPLDPTTLEPPWAGSGVDGTAPPGGVSVPSTEHNFIGVRHIDPTQTQEFAIPGEYNTAVFDPLSERMVIVVGQLGPPGAWVFDGLHQALVGLMDMNTTQEFATPGCVDVRTGYFYTTESAEKGLTPAQQDQRQDWGVMIGQPRATPVAQAAGYHDIAGVPPSKTTTVSIQACDSAHRRFFAQLDDEWLVVQDNTPPPAPHPPMPDPDQATTDVAKFDPVTDQIAYESDGRAFGARVSAVGGYDAALNQVAPVKNDADLTKTTNLESVVSGSTPTVVLGATGLPGKATDVSLSGSQVTAAASGGDPGDVLRAALSANGESPQSPWPYSAVTCSVSGGAKPLTSSSSGATATCDPGVEAAGSGASTGSTQLAGVVDVTDAWSSVDSKLDPKQGVIVTASRAGVKAVSLLGGMVQIDDVEAAALSKAGGRTGTAAGSYIRSIGQLVISGNTVCQPCDPSQVAQAINEIPGGEIQAELPAVQGATPVQGSAGVFSVPGTPLGYQALVLRDQWEQLNDQNLNQISPNDQEVPALRLSVAEDGFDHDDLLVDLGAVESGSHLGIHPQTAVPTPPTTTPPLTVPTTVPAVVPTTVPATTATTVFPGFRFPSGGSGGNPPQGSSPIGSAYVPSASSTIPPSSGGNTIVNNVQQVLGRLGRGLREALASPRHLVDLVLVWVVLSLPIYLSSRRRLVTLRRAALS